MGGIQELIDRTLSAPIRSGLAWEKVLDEIG
jgi:hypothetical protein